MTFLRGRFRKLFSPPAAVVPIPPPAPQPTPATVACYHLRSARGDWLRIDSNRLAAKPARDQAFAAILMIPQTAPGRAILIGADASTFGIAGDTISAQASSVLVLQTDAPGIARLKYPIAGPVFLSVDPDAPTSLRFAGDGGTMDAAFTLVKLGPADMPALAQAIAAEVGRAAASGLRATVLLDQLRGGGLRPELVAPLARLLPADELEALALRLLDSPPSLALLRRAMPDDVWIRRILPALATWCGGGRPPVIDQRALSPAEDEAALLPAGEQGQVPLGLALTGLARRQVRPTRLACLLATARNEGPYLLDWIAYHLSIGFEHIFLYSNENTDGSDALLAALAEGGAITWIDNQRGPSMGPQTKAYTHALTMLPQILDYRWTAILDIDEYLGFDTKLFGGIADFIALQECQPVDAVAMCWQFFAALPGEAWTDAPSTTRFMRRERTTNAHVKTLFRTRMFWYSQPHYPSATLASPFTYRTQDGHLHHHPGVANRIAAFAEQPAATQAWINHYFLRTAEEALYKFSRGRADWLAEASQERRADFLHLITHAFFQLARPEHLVEDRRILACAKDEPAMRARLMALPGVAEADAEIRARHAADLARNTQAFLQSSWASQATGELAEFCGVLRA